LSIYQWSYRRKRISGYRDKLVGIASKTRISIGYPIDNGLDMDINFFNWIGYGYVIF
jgi:hypothetical protein